MPTSVHVPPSTSSARRSPPVTFSAACWRPIPPPPPPGTAAARRSARPPPTGRRIEGGASVLMPRTVPVGSGKSYSLLRPQRHIDALALRDRPVAPSVGRDDGGAVAPLVQPLHRQLDPPRPGLQGALDREANPPGA